MDILKTKKCNKCGEVKPLTEFYTSNKTKDGRDTQCKKCKQIYHDLLKAGALRSEEDRIEYYKINYGKGLKYIDREVDRTNGKKRCAKCNKVYPNTLDYFHKDQQTKDKLHYYCKKCRNEVRRRYWEEKQK